VIRSLALACILFLLSAIAARAEYSTNGFESWYRDEHATIEINDVLVCNRCAIYVDEEKNVYVASSDIDAWGLKRPRTGSFNHEGVSYFALQTDLNLATTYDFAGNTVEVVAPRNAFRGESGDALPLTPAHGSFLNYQITRENGQYDFVTAARGGVLQVGYLSTSTGEGMRFSRARTRWFDLNARSHSVLGLGEETTAGSWLGISAPFAGIHFASDFSADPDYAPHGPREVSGFAESPSLLEVYANNVLEVRREVPEGPFTVNDLPEWVANSDIVMVLTDKRGSKSYQIARPEYDPSLLARNRHEFRLDAGLAHGNAGLPQQFYRGFVGQGTLRYGLTDRITSELFSESIDGEDFTDAGADVLVAPNMIVGFRAGGGNRRHASEYRYELRGSKVRFRANASFNSQASQPFAGIDFDNVVSRLSERADLSISINPKWDVSAQFNGFQTSTGSPQSTLSASLSYRAEALSFNLAPTYDTQRHTTSANVSLSLTLTPNQTIATESLLSSSGESSTAVEWRKEPADSADPLSIKVRTSAYSSQDRRVEVADNMKWARASIDWQQQYARSIFEPRLSGALAFVAGKIQPLPTVDDGESFGLLAAPIQNARVTLNLSDAGRTDPRGRLVLRHLSPYRANTLHLLAADAPIWADIAPVTVVPAKWSAVAVRITVISRGGFTIRAFDTRGRPLAPAGEVLDATGKRFPIGYDGHVYLTGLRAGIQRLRANSEDGPCTVVLTVPANLDDIPDLGRQVCRP
jgi:outer membrane usher protein